MTHPHQKDTPCPMTDTTAVPTGVRRSTLSERDAAMLRLRLASPKRGNPGRQLTPQADASDCPLFRAANEPSLL